LDSKTDEEVFAFFANWYSRNIDASDRLHPNDWKVIPYKYMHIIRDNHCIGFHLGFTSLESAYQKLIERKNPKEKQTQDSTPPQQSPN